MNTVAQIIIALCMLGMVGIGVFIAGIILCDVLEERNWRRRRPW